MYGSLAAADEDGAKGVCKFVLKGATCLPGEGSGAGHWDSFMFPAGTTKETTTTPTTTTPEHVHHPQACVSGHNIKLYHDKTVQECKSICDKTAGCIAFEYGVAHGGATTRVTKPAQCQPQSSANKAACSGAHHNLDLYVYKPHNVINT